MKWIHQTKWFIFVAWVALTISLTMLAPNMEELVREKGQVGVPEGYSSEVAADLLKQMNPEGESGGELQTALVFHRAEGLTDDDLREVKQAIERLESLKAAIGIHDIVSHLETPELEKQLVAEDGQTLIVGLSLADEFSLSRGERRVALENALEGLSVDYAYTGGWLIDEDVVTSSQEGLKKTEYITLAFILAILFIVFRSAVAPFIPLLAVGISYVVSQSIVAFLVDGVNFPLSNFLRS